LGNGEGVSPPQPTRGSGERRKLPQRSPGQSPGEKKLFYDFTVFCACQNASRCNVC